MTKDSDIVCLIKPQFEAGREKVGKKGVVRDKKVHEEVIENVVGFSGEFGLIPVELDYSPVKGPEGNIEYLLHLKNPGAEVEGLEGIINLAKIKETVNRAHEDLD